MSRRKHVDSDHSSDDESPSESRSLSAQRARKKSSEKQSKKKSRTKSTHRRWARIRSLAGEITLTANRKQDDDDSDDENYSIDKEYIRAARTFARCVDMHGKLDKLIKIKFMLQQDNAIKNGELEEDADVTERRRARLESMWVCILLLWCESLRGHYFCAVAKLTGIKPKPKPNPMKVCMWANLDQSWEPYCFCFSWVECTAIELCIISICRCHYISQKNNTSPQRWCSCKLT